MVIIRINKPKTNDYKQTHTKKKEHIFSPMTAIWVFYTKNNCHEYGRIYIKKWSSTWLPAMLHNEGSQPDGTSP